LKCTEVTSVHVAAVRCHLQVLIFKNQCLPVYHTSYTFATQVMKALLQYILFLYVLLNGYSHLHARTSECAILSIVNDQKSEQVVLCTADNDASGLRFISLGTDKRRFELSVPFIENRENEEEDDESVSLRKRIESGSYSTAIFSTYTLGYFFNYSKKILSFQSSFSYSSSYQYLLFQVFRI